MQGIVHACLVAVCTGFGLVACGTLIGMEDLTIYQEPDGAGGSGGGGVAGAGQAGTTGNGGSVDGGNAGRGGSSGAAGSAAGGSAGQSGSGGQGGGGQVEAGPDGTMSNDPNVVCSEVAAATCAAYQRCSVILKYSFGTLDVCLARTKILCVAEMTAPGTGATAQLERACAASLANDVCAGLGSTCARAGLLADGSSCWTPWQCSGGACSIAPGQPCGSCRKRSALGGSCYSSPDCQDPRGMTCDGVTTTTQGTCAQWGVVGSACGAMVRIGCRPDLWCNGSTCSGTAKAMLGETCMPVPCDQFQGLNCDPTTRKCIEWEYPPPGSPCSVAFLCGGGAICRISDNVCVGPAPDGNACDSGNGPGCLAPASCLNHVCVLPGQRCP